MHVVGLHVKSHIRRVQKIVRKILFDEVALVAAANNEVIDAVMRVHLHDVPENGLATNFDHGLGTRGGFFAETGTQPASQNNSFHFGFQYIYGDEQTNASE